VSLKLQSFDLGTNAATITAANSGGGTNTPFGTPNVGTGATLIYDSGSLKNGVLGMRIVSGTTGATTVHWTDTSAPDFAAACWWKFDAAPAAAFQGPIIIRSSSDTGGARLQLATNRTMTIVGATLTSSASSALTAGNWYYCDFTGTGLGGTAAYTADIYNADGSVHAALTLSADTTTLTAGRTRFGNASSVSGLTHRFDDLRANIGDATPHGFPAVTASDYVRKSGAWVAYTPQVRKSSAWV
jgi:hypothetical protein